MTSITHNGFKFDADYSVNFRIEAHGGLLTMAVYTEAVEDFVDGADILELWASASLRLPGFLGVFSVKARVVDINRAAIAMRHAAAALGKKKMAGVWEFLPSVKLMCLMGSNGGSVFDGFFGLTFTPDSDILPRVDRIDVVRLMDMYSRYDSHAGMGRRWTGFIIDVEKVVLNLAAICPVALGQNPFFA